MRDKCGLLTDITYSLMTISNPISRESLNRQRATQHLAPDRKVIRKNSARS